MGVEWAWSGHRRTLQERGVLSLKALPRSFDVFDDAMAPPPGGESGQQVLAGIRRDIDGGDVYVPAFTRRRLAAIEVVGRVVGVGFPGGDVEVTRPPSVQLHDPGCGDVTQNTAANFDLHRRRGHHDMHAGYRVHEGSSHGDLRER